MSLNVITGVSSPGVPGAPRDPQILADQLTLSQPGGRLCPSNNTGFSDLPTALHRQLLATNWAPEIDLRTGSWLTCDFFRQITITKIMFRAICINCFQAYLAIYKEKCRNMIYALETPHRPKIWGASSNMTGKICPLNPNRINWPDLAKTGEGDT